MRTKTHSISSVGREKSMAQWIANDHFSFVAEHTFNWRQLLFIQARIYSNAENDLRIRTTYIGVVSVMCSATNLQLKHFPKLHKKNDGEKPDTPKYGLWRDAAVEESKLSNDSNYFCEFEIRIKTVKIKLAKRKRNQCVSENEEETKVKKSWIYQLAECCRLPLRYGVYRIVLYIWVCWHRRRLFILSILIAVSSHSARTVVSSLIFSFFSFFFFHFDSSLHLAVFTFALDKRTRALYLIYPRISLSVYSVAGSFLTRRYFLHLTFNDSFLHTVEIKRVLIKHKRKSTKYSLSECVVYVARAPRH